MRCVAAASLSTVICGYAAPQFDQSVYDTVKSEVIHITCVSENRTGTGFLWSTPDTAVTALHVVAGCGNILIHYEALGVSHSATISKVYSPADLALLKINDAPAGPVMSVRTTPPSLTEQLSTLGYPMQIGSMQSTALQLRYGGKTLRDIVPASVAQTLAGGSPSLDLNIDGIEGHLLPGHSGAPIFDGQQKVVAIADGGLENGAVAISWGIPVDYLTQLVASKEPTSIAGGGPAHTAASHLLFASEGDVKNRGQFTCSGLSLAKLRSVSYPQASKSVDDPLGLAQLVQFFGVDPSSFVFDVYQHLLSGATFVLPAGSRLDHDANGNCVASLPSGGVQLRLQVATLDSIAQAQGESQLFEQMIVNGNTLGWMPDAQWTTAMPFTRFDAMTVRRRAYMHVQTAPVMFQDKYLFETMAVRGQVFIGSAAIYSVSPAIAQKLLPCRMAGFAGDCADARQLFGEWVQAVLAIQLTTFPVG